MGQIQQRAQATKHCLTHTHSCRAALKEQHLSEMQSHLSLCLGQTVWSSFTFLPVKMRKHFLHPQNRGEFVLGKPKRKDVSLAQ